MSSPAWRAMRGCLLSALLPRRASILSPKAAPLPSAGRSRSRTPALLLCRRPLCGSRNRQRLSELSACSGYTSRQPRLKGFQHQQLMIAVTIVGPPTPRRGSGYSGVFQVDPPASPSSMGPSPYGAVLLSGTKKRSVSTPSWSKSQSLSIPGVSGKAVVRLTTRWQG